MITHPELWYIYDAGFRWGKPDFTFTWPMSPVNQSFERSNWQMKNSACTIPGCYICRPRPSSEST